MNSRGRGRDRAHPPVDPDQRVERLTAMQVCVRRRVAGVTAGHGETWSPTPVSAAEQERGHAEDGEEREEEGGVERGGQVASQVPLGEGRGLQLVQLHFPNVIQSH